MLTLLGITRSLYGNPEYIAGVRLDRSAQPCESLLRWNGLSGLSLVRSEPGIYFEQLLCITPHLLSKRSEWSVSLHTIGFSEVGSVIVNRSKTGANSPHGVQPRQMIIRPTHGFT